MIPDASIGLPHETDLKTAPVFLKHIPHSRSLFTSPLLQSLCLTSYPSFPNYKQPDVPIFMITIGTASFVMKAKRHGIISGNAQPSNRDLPPFLPAQS